MGATPTSWTEHTAQRGRADAAGGTYRTHSRVEGATAFGSAQCGGGRLATTLARRSGTRTERPARASHRTIRDGVEAHTTHETGSRIGRLRQRPGPLVCRCLR